MSRTILVTASSMPCASNGPTIRGSSPTARSGFDGERTTLNNGVYTACEICEEDPSKPPLWQIKARRVTQDGRTKTIRLEGAHFELFGRPIAYLPFLTVPDHTVKRKSGFLIPSSATAKELGAKVGVPYYFALNPHYDLTVTISGYTRQGFLGEAEFRQQFETGKHVLKIAGIHQLSTRCIHARARWMPRMVNRGMIASQATIPDQSALDVRLGRHGAERQQLLQHLQHRRLQRESRRFRKILSDRLSGRNFFDLRGFYFDVQSTIMSAIPARKSAADHSSVAGLYSLHVRPPEGRRRTDASMPTS